MPTPSSCPAQDAAINTVVGFLDTKLYGLYKFYDKTFDENNPIFKDIDPNATGRPQITGPAAKIISDTITIRLTVNCGNRNIIHNFTARDILEIASFTYPGPPPEIRYKFQINKVAVDKMIQDFSKKVSKSCNNQLPDKCEKFSATLSIYRTAGYISTPVDVPVWRP